MASRYIEVYRYSLDTSERFWGKAAEQITWYKPPDRVLDSTNPPFYRWFPGSVLNTCYNVLDRHVERGRGSQPALIYDSTVTAIQQTYTYQDLLDLVARCAHGLSRVGVMKGDRVVLYMPMIPEAYISMLACARIGAVNSVVFGGFASPELATRINDAKPRLVISASCGIEITRIIPYKPLLDRAIEQSAVKPEHCIIVQRPQLRASLVEGRDCNWSALMGERKHPVSRWQQPIPSISFTPLVQPESPRGLSETMVAT